MLLSAVRSFIVFYGSLDQNSELYSFILISLNMVLESRGLFTTISVWVWFSLKIGTRMSIISVVFLNLRQDLFSFILFIHF